VIAEKIRVSVLMSACILLGSCGGGSTPPPGEQPPDPVEELSVEDFAEAGIPSVASLHASMMLQSLVGDWNDDGSVTSTDFVQWHNLGPGASGGIAVNVPASELGRRIVAWAIYALPLGTDAHLAVLKSPFDSSGNVRWFFALANAGTDSWELGGRILADTATSQSYFTSSDPLPPGFQFRRSFSMGQDYVFPDGNAYLLLLAAHPGTTDVSGYINNTELWDWRSIRNSAADGFGAGVEGSYDWSLVGGPAAAESIFRYIEQGDVHRQIFSVSNMGPNDVDTYMLFSQPFNPLVNGEQDLPPNGVVDAEDYTIWRYAFFCPGEMNAAAHPFLLEREGSAAGQLNVVPLLHVPGLGAPNGIIAILIGLLGPIPDADVTLLTAGEEIQLKTGKAGEFVIPFTGTDTFTYTLVYDDGGGTSLSYALEVHPDLGTCRIR